MITKHTKFQPAGDGAPRTVWTRTERTKSLVLYGELPAVRVALESAEVAPGNLATLREPIQSGDWVTLAKG